MNNINQAIKQNTPDMVKDVGQNLTVDLAKDIFEQISGSNSSQKTTDQTQPNQPNRQMLQVQKNIKMANLSKNIKMMQQRRQEATQARQKMEQERLQKLEEEKQAKQQEQDEGFGDIAKKSLNSFSAIFARRGRGEQRGAGNTKG